MSGPGKGRYTTYVPVASDKNKLLWKLFNGRAGSRGQIYGTEEQSSDNSKAASVVLARATAPVNAKGVGGLFPSDGVQVGDADMFSSNGGKVDLNFKDAPNTAAVSWKKPGDPANAYVPDITSPGPERTEGVQKDVNPGISTVDVKGDKFVPGPGVASPNSTSTNVGLGPLGKNLTQGSSTIPTSSK